MVRHALALSIVLGACPESPRFEGASDASDVLETTATGDVGATDADDPTADAADVSDAPDTPDTPDTNDPPSLPCAPSVGCTVAIGDGPTPVLGILVDHTGRALAAIAEDKGDLTYDLQLARHHGAGGWRFEPVGAGLTFPTDVFVAEDGAHRVHLLAEALTERTSPTIWYRPTATGWEPDNFIDDAHCERPKFVAGADGLLYASCVIVDEVQLHIRTLDDANGVLSWTPRFVAETIGWKDGPAGRVLPLDWDIDGDGDPHIGYRCCDYVSPDLYYRTRNATVWGPSENLGTTTVGSGAGTLNVRTVIDGAGHAHVIYQTYVAETALATLYDHHWDGFAWQQDLIDEGSSVGSELALGIEVARDGVGNLHLAYRDGERLSYRKWRNNVWGAEVQSEHVVDVTLQLSLVTDASDAAHIGYTSADDLFAWWWVPRVAN